MLLCYLSQAFDICTHITCTNGGFHLDFLNPIDLYTPLNSQQ